MSKKICANCHFFVRHHHIESGPSHTLEVSDAQRAMAKRGDLSWQREVESLGCYKGIWDEGIGFGGATKVDAISKRRRRGECYFFKFQSGTILSAAEKLQQERYAITQDTQKYRLTIYGLLLTIVGLITKLIYERVA